MGEYHGNEKKTKKNKQKCPTYFKALKNVYVCHNN